MTLLQELGIDSRLIVSVFLIGIGWFLAKRAGAKISTVLENISFDTLCTSPLASAKLYRKKSAFKEFHSPSKWLGAWARVSVMLVVMIIVLKYYDFTDIRDLLKHVLSHSWTILLTTGVALFISRLLTNQAVVLIQSESLQAKFAEVFPIADSNTAVWSEFGPIVIMMTVYFMIFSLEILAIMQSYDLTIAANALIMLWSLIIKLLSVLLISLIGWYGLNALKKQENNNLAVDSASTTDRLDDGVRKVFIGVFTFIAIMVVASQLVDLFFWLFLLVVVAIVVTFWQHIPNAVAGIYVYFAHVKKFNIDEDTAELKQRGWLYSEWEVDDTMVTMGNKQVMDYHLGLQKTQSST